MFGLEVKSKVFLETFVFGHRSLIKDKTQTAVINIVKS